MIHDTLESVKYDDQIMSKLNQRGKPGIGYVEPENSKPSWLKNRLDKNRARAGLQSSDLHQQRRNPVKVRKHNRAYQLRRDLDGQSTKPMFKRSHSISSRTLVDTYTGKL
ncbi:DNA-directed RNA polymerase II subunit 3 [Dorcoceras hygrometricum]|uniref:DNA-directed RNA polymerase II subunit 3 n=1 Tax=Dorcoceras hygrometricum TaxID=472368 RepID=A0A2Z7BP23_9LAMI|nr:DNA-directed RNA polymerase II subunit 3 [Dorcoceras hygrometricum]